ncbi:MAG: hypothetical protein ABSC01_06645 [Verrucomicrobiota bacterium]
MHRFVKAASSIEHLGQFIAAGVLDVLMPGFRRNQVTQLAFGVLNFIFATVKERGKVAGLVIPGINGQARFDRRTSFRETMVLLRQNSHGHARVDGRRIGRRRLFKPGPSLFRLAQTLALMANLQHELAVAWLQFNRLAPCPVSQVHLGSATGSASIFKPDLGLAWELLNQLLISRQGLGKV